MKILERTLLALLCIPMFCLVLPLWTIGKLARVENAYMWQSTPFRVTKYIVYGIKE